MKDKRAHTIANLLQELDSVLAVLNLDDLDALTNFLRDKVDIRAARLFGHAGGDITVDDFVALGYDEVPLKKVDHFGGGALENLYFAG